MSNTSHSAGIGPSQSEPTVVQPPAPTSSAPVQLPSTVIQPSAEAVPSQEQESRLAGDTTAQSKVARLDSPRELTGEFGRYRILRRLGKGGMGVVYLALDTQLDRQVALKVPFFDADDDPDLIDRFHREARSMATLHHPNLCPVYDVSEIDAVRFLTMAYVAGRSLAEQLKQDRPYSNEQAAALIEKLARALDSAHQAGIVHRDLKPANIMIRSDGEPVIMDFGLARRHKDGEADLTHSGMLLGTPAYMAPEQVAGQNDSIGAGTDVYALGVILYQLLAGRPPFQGAVGTVLASIVHDQPKALRELSPLVDARLEAICLKAMAKTIEQRFRSACELADDLRRFLQSTAVPGPAIGNAPMPTSSHAKRNAPPHAVRRRLRRSLVVGAGILALGIAGVTVFQELRQQLGTDGSGVWPKQVRPDPKSLSSEASAVASARADDPFAPRIDAPDQSWRLPPEPRRFPSLKDTISQPPSWLIADKDPPFDLVRYFEVPVWEDNAAPAYLKALFEFSSEVFTCFPESTREKQSPIVNARWARFGNLHNQWSKERGSVPEQQFEPALEEFETGFELLRQAQRKRECVFEIGAGQGSLMPHIQASHAVAIVATHRARRDLRKGRLDAVIADVDMILRFAHDINYRGSAPCFMVATLIDSVVCDEIIRPILLHPEFTKQHCERLLAILMQHERQQDEMLRQALQGEYIVLRVNSHDVQYHIGSFSSKFLNRSGWLEREDLEPRSPGGALARLLGTMRSLPNAGTGQNQDDSVNRVRMAQRIDAMADADYEQEAAIANSCFRSLLATCERPVWERLRLASRIRHQVSRNQNSRIVRYAGLPNLTVQTDRRNRAQLAGLICLTSLRLWQFERAEPPDSLESLLAVAGIDDLIPDPYGSGEPLRFALIDSQAMIYSLGIDEYDDGGRKEWDLSPDGTGDMTFRLETLEALLQRRVPHNIPDSGTVP